MNNTITIDGVTIELTKEQVEKLKVELGVEKKSPFERAELNKGYYFIEKYGYLNQFEEMDDGCDAKLYSIANYCTDKDLLTKRAKEEVLSRLLWRFSMENDGDKIDWSVPNNKKYYVFYNHSAKKYDISFNDAYQNIGCIYFYSKEIAQRAIDEIIIPFNEGKLPCCEIWKE